MYVLVVSLSDENDKKLLEQLRTKFKRTIKWNKYRSEMTSETKKKTWIIWLIQHLPNSIDRLA